MHVSPEPCMSKLKDILECYCYVLLPMLVEFTTEVQETSYCLGRSLNALQWELKV